jgi:hypothetical protein
MGMMDYVSETARNLHVEVPEALSNSERGSNHPSQECFMAKTPEGLVEDVNEESDSPSATPNGEVSGYAESPTHLGIEQL